jgi:peroxiredoxin
LKLLLVKLPRPAPIVAGVLIAALGAAVAIGAWTILGARSPAPSVSYTLLDGSKQAIDHHHGKVLLVNFWATSCVACVAEMPQLAATHRKFNSLGYETLAVAMSYDRPDAVLRFAQTRDLPFGVTFDRSGDIAARFGDVQLTPTSFLIDRQGRIVRRWLGKPDFDALDVLIGKLLADG